MCLSSLICSQYQMNFQWYSHLTIRWAAEQAGYKLADLASDFLKRECVAPLLACCSATGQRGNGACLVARLGAWCDYMPC